MGLKKQYNDLTVFAFAFLDKSFVLDVLVAGLTVVPSSGNKITKYYDYERKVGNQMNLKYNRLYIASENFRNT